MPAFFDDYEYFRGDGSVNRDGQTLDEFLEIYDPYKYKNPCVTADALVFAYDQPTKEGRWQVLLVKRSNHPSIHHWACPGGFCELHEDLDVSPRRELEEETGVKGLPLEQVAIYGDERRDPRARIITAVYMSAIPMNTVKVQAADDADDALWFDIDVRSELMPDDEWLIHHHDVTLTNIDHDVTLSAKIVEKERKGLIKEHHFTISESNLFACDHAAIITQCFLTLMRRL